MQKARQQDNLNDLLELLRKIISRNISGIMNPKLYKQWYLLYFINLLYQNKKIISNKLQKLDYIKKIN